MGEVKSLRGSLPICSCCKKIRTEDGASDKLEAQLSRHADADFFHGISPDREE